jgi:hypothetical protein
MHTLNKVEMSSYLSFVLTLQGGEGAHIWALSWLYKVEKELISELCVDFTRRRSSSYLSLVLTLYRWYTSVYLKLLSFFLPEHVIPSSVKRR